MNISTGARRENTMQIRQTRKPIRFSWWPFISATFIKLLTWPKLLSAFPWYRCPGKTTQMCRVIRIKLIVCNNKTRKKLKVGSYLFPLQQSCRSICCCHCSEFVQWSSNGQFQPTCKIPIILLLSCRWAKMGFILAQIILTQNYNNGRI